MSHPSVYESVNDTTSELQLKVLYKEHTKVPAFRHKHRLLGRTSIDPATLTPVPQTLWLSLFPPSSSSPSPSSPPPSSSSSSSASTSAASSSLGGAPSTLISKFIGGRPASSSRSSSSATSDEICVENERKVVGKIQIRAAKLKAKNWTHGMLSDYGHPIVTVPLRVDVGDIILFHEKAALAKKAVQLAQGSRFDHMAMIISLRGRPAGEFHMLESTMNGVAIYKLGERLDYYRVTAELGIRRLNIKRTEEMKDELYKYGLISFFLFHFFYFIFFISFFLFHFLFHFFFLFHFIFFFFFFFLFHVFFYFILF